MGAGSHLVWLDPPRDLVVVLRWIDKRRIDEVTLFSPPKFLGELRKQYRGTLADRILERQGDLTQLSTGGLAKHGAVVALLNSN